MLAAAACVRLAPPSAFAPPPEPRFADAPPADQLAAGPEADDDARVAALHARLEAVEEEIVNLRKALDVLGPLPDHADLFIPVEWAELEEASVPASIALFQEAGFGAPRPAAIAFSGSFDVGYEGADEDFRLSGLTDDDTLDALVVELSALAGPARVVAPIRAR